MSRDIKINLMTTIASIMFGIIVWSLTAFAYAHNTFTNKEMFNLLMKRIDRIELKIDKLIERENNHGS